MSTKYRDYYVGRLPTRWYHRRALANLRLGGQVGRVLDFGCFDGFFTSRLLQEGFDASGCDWNRSAIERGRQLFGLSSRLSTYPEGNYDALVALEVIEHFEDPNDFFAVVKDHLRVEGTLILSCPLKDAIYRPKTDAPPHHFSRFTQRSLFSILNRHGFEVMTYERETSSVQLIRNLVGDSLRRGPALEPVRDNTNAARLAIRLGKTVMDMVDSTMTTALLPIDRLLGYLGIYYISQLVVARRLQSCNAC